MGCTFGGTVNNMNLHTDEFYTAAIKNIYPNSWDVRKPAVPGGVNPVFLCDTSSGTKVCRFSNSDIVFRNRYVSDLLTMYEIPVPKTQVYAYLDTWFESYDYCHAPTLHERIQEGISNADVFNIYKQATDMQRKISQIRPEYFKPTRYKYMHEVFCATQKMRVNPILAYTYGFIHRLCSNSGNVYLLHNDIYDKNMLVDETHSLARLIDLDAVALCNESFSVMMTLRMYPLANHCEYMDYYEDTMQRKINREAIMTGLKILNTIRKPQVALNRLLWHGYNAPPGR